MCRGLIPAEESQIMLVFILVPFGKISKTTGTLTGAVRTTRLCFRSEDSQETQFCEIFSVPITLNDPPVRWRVRLVHSVLSSPVVYWLREIMTSLIVNWLSLCSLR